MCNCCCKCNSSTDSLLEMMAANNEAESKERHLRREYVWRNIHTVVELVRKYNEMAKETPQNADNTIIILPKKNVSPQNSKPSTSNETNTSIIITIIIFLKLIQ